jgi:hypothetical protein
MQAASAMRVDVSLLSGPDTRQQSGNLVEAFDESRRG